MDNNVNTGGIIIIGLTLIANLILKIYQMYTKSIETKLEAIHKNEMEIINTNNKNKLEVLDRISKIENEHLNITKNNSPAGTPQVLFENNVFKDFKERQLRAKTRTDDLIKIDKE